MKTHILGISQTTGSESGFNPLVRLLNQNTPNFGSGFSEFNIHVYFDDETHTLSKAMFEIYREKLDGLPKATVYRKKGQVQLAYVSKICSGIEYNQLLHGWHPPMPRDNQSLAMLKLLGAELVAVVSETISRSLKNSDSFDSPAYVLWLENCVLRLPNDTKELQSMLDSIN